MKIIRVIKALTAGIVVLAFALVTALAAIYVALCVLSLFSFTFRSAAFDSVSMPSCVLAITEVILAISYASKMSCDCWIYLWIYGYEAE